MALSGVPAYQQNEALRLAPAATPAVPVRPVAAPRYRVNDSAAPAAKRLDVYDAAEPAAGTAMSPVGGASGFGAVTLGRYVDVYA